MTTRTELRNAYVEYVIEDIYLTSITLIPILYSLTLNYIFGAEAACQTAALFGLIALVCGYAVTCRKPPINWNSLYSSDLNENQISQSIEIYKKHTTLRVERRYLVRVPVSAAVLFATIVWYFR